MAFDQTTGLFSFTSSNNAEATLPGQLITSNLWDTAHSDMQTAFSALGPGLIPIINGGIASIYASPVVANINFAATAGTDIASFQPATQTLAYTNFRFVALQIYKASASLNSVTVSLYTGANASGNTVISSTVVTITSSLPNTANSLMRIAANSTNDTTSYADSFLFLHITTSIATAGTASAFLIYEPVPTL